LCLSNLLANAIKYSDPAKDKRWVEVRAHVAAPDDGGPLETVVEVRDNGLGVPEAKRSELFKRFFRAHEDSNVAIEGTGLASASCAIPPRRLEEGLGLIFAQTGRLSSSRCRARRVEDGVVAATIAVPVAPASGWDDRTAEDSAR